MEIYSETQKLIAFLESDSSEAKAIKANLRHSVGNEPGDNPFLFGWMIAHLNPDLHGKGGNVSFAENAVFTALTMFAVGPRNGKLPIAQAASEAEIKREKLAQAEMACDMNEMRTVLRALVKLIASKGYTFDYGKLAEDLYSWQMEKTKIARKWEREYVMKGEKK